MKPRTAVLAMMALALLPGRTAAQEATRASSAVHPAVARRSANTVRVSGAPKLLTWAQGLSDPSDVERYAATGLNTACLAVTDASEDGLASASALAGAAEGEGLLVIGALAPRAISDSEGEEIPADPTSDAYAEAVDQFVSAVVEGMGDHPRLIGWSVEAVPPSDVVLNDAGFAAYLSEWYASVAALNDSWGTAFDSWDAVSLAGARDIDSGLPGGIGRASVDLAYYQASAYRDTMEIWARAISAAAPGRLVFASALPDYRSIISVGSGFDGMVLNVYPTLAEADWRTHNVHAVDIARRANAFAVVQTLEVQPQTSAEQLASWAGQAMVHGAAGVAFSDWTRLRDSEALRAAVEDVARLGEEGGFPVEPMPRAAVLYEPIAGGAMRNGRGLYGYLDGVGPNTPTNLFAVGRNGSRFGQFDVLSQETLDEVDLSQYGAIIAPMALDLPDRAQLALHTFALRGGIVVADAGVGMYQAEGVLTSMPPLLREMMGLQYVDLAAELGYGTAEQQTGVQVGEVWDPATGGEIAQVVPGQGDRRVDPGLARFVQQLQEFLTRPDVARALGDDVLGGVGEGLRVNRLGNGFAIYAPTFLYETWLPADAGFHEFHARILSRGSELEVVDPSGVWPGVAAALQRGWGVALASPEGRASSVVVYGVGNQLYQVPSGAMRVEDPSGDGRGELLFPGAFAAVAEAIPISVTPAGEGMTATVAVSKYGRDGVELTINGSGASARVGGDGIEVVGGTTTGLEVVVEDGPYSVSPGSLHRVTVSYGPTFRRTVEQEMMPDRDTGALVIRDAFAQGRITIEPAG